MRKIYTRGYINHENKEYTFVYEDKKLTLISVKNEQTFFKVYKYIDFFEGVTVDGFDIVFHIKDDIFYKDGCFICFPKSILISQAKAVRLAETKFDTVKIIGNNINRFYSNRRMISFNDEKFESKKCEYFDLKTEEETISEENVNLNGRKTTFELSIHRPTWKDDGCYSFGQFDSTMRIKYNEGIDYKDVIKDLVKIEKLFQFCANGNNITFDKVFLEVKKNVGKYVHAVEIIVPYMVDNEINKDMLDYGLLKGHIDRLIKTLQESNYVFSIIPDDDNEYEVVSNKDFCATFSCFQSIYQYVHGNDDISKSEMSKNEVALEEVKKELIPILEEIDEQYKGRNSLKRKYIERFKNIINTANLNLVKCVKNEIEDKTYLIETLFYKVKEKIDTLGIQDSIEQAVQDRDDITHNKTIKLDEISIGIYQIVCRLNYIMILEHAGVEKDKIESAIEFLSMRDII